MLADPGSSSTEDTLPLILIEVPSAPSLPGSPFSPHLAHKAGVLNSPHVLF
mgnify:FL=1|jgi:hypothetical protein